MRASRAFGAPVAGLAVLALHALALPGLLAHCHSEDLSLALAGPVTVAAPDGRVPDDARVPAALAKRTRRLVDGAPAPAAPLAPGVHRVELGVSYRGGFSRRVGRTVLAGPLQDPAHPPCGVHLVVSQKLLDTLAPSLKKAIEDGLAGQLGFRKVADLELGFVADRGGGIVVALELEFSHGHVPVAVVVRPRVQDGALTLDVGVDARVDLSNGTAQAALDFLGLDKRLNELVSDMARDQVQASLAPIAAFLAAPPPIPLDHGDTLALAYCASEPITYVTKSYMAVPLAVPLPAVPDSLYPVHLDPGPPPGAPDGPLALDISLDALNGVLAQLWASGYLDARLATEGLEARFNELPDVQALLTLRLGPPHLTMPPTLERNLADPRRPFTLALEAGLILQDGALATPARLFGRMSLDLRTGPDGHLVTDPSITALDVTCNPAPDRLEPCYSTIVDWAKDGTSALHGPIASELGHWFDDTVSQRDLGSPAGGGFHITSIKLSPRLSARSAWLRVDLDGVPLTP